LHVEAGGDNPPRLGDLSTDQLVSRCLSCHGLGESQVSRFSQSAHGTNKIPCVDCHQVHPEKGNFRLLTAEAPTLCVSCHRTVESDFRKPFHHPVLEGGMNCTDCHDPHSDLNRSAHRLETVPGNGCLSCHPSKEGPFVFPHASLEANGCGACHQAHGSFNSKLLVRSQVHQLCLECHTMTAGVATSQPPAIHDLRSARYRNCTICHREIHGSNVNPAFLR
jgi:DmsE family decaheme c-type cytochrome